jgi:hypothetical protein
MLYPADVSSPEGPSMAQGSTGAARRFPARDTT